MQAVTRTTLTAISCATLTTISRTVPRMPVPNRHVTGQGHHRSPQPSRPHH